MKPTVVGLILMLCVNGLAFAQTESSDVPLLMFRGVRPMALGNAFEAIADDTNALYYNPAGIAQSEETLVEVLFARPRITLDLAGERSEFYDLIDAINTLADSGEPLEDPDPAVRDARDSIVDDLERLIQEELALIADLPSLSMLFPIAEIRSVKLSLGFAAYTQLNTFVDVSERGLAWSDPVKAILDDTVIYRVMAQWSLAGTISAEVPLSLPFLSKAYGGFTIRRINRRSFSNEDNPFTMEDVLGDPDAFAEDYFNIEEGDDFVDFVRDNFESQKGYSTDFGLMVVPVEGLQLGFTIRNLASNLTSEDTDEEQSFPRNTVLAVAAKPLNLLHMQNSMLDLTVAASIDDPNGDEGLNQFSSNNLDKLHFGVEAVLWPNAPLSLAGRIGSNQGFPTFGAGLQLGPLDLQFARYGDLQADWYVGSLGLTF